MDHFTSGILVDRLFQPQVLVNLGAVKDSLGIRMRLSLINYQAKLIELYRVDDEVSSSEIAFAEYCRSKWKGEFHSVNIVSYICTFYQDLNMNGYCKRELRMNQ